MHSFILPHCHRKFQQIRQWGPPNIISLYRNTVFRSTEFFIAVNYDPNVDVSTPFFLFLCHIIGSLLQNISIPVMDLLVVLSPAWLASKKQWVGTDLPLGIGISKGIGSQVWGYKSSQSKFQNISPDIIGFLGSKYSLRLGTCLRYPNILYTAYRWPFKHHQLVREQGYFQEYAYPSNLDCPTQDSYQLLIYLQSLCKYIRS